MTLNKSGVCIQGSSEARIVHDSNTMFKFNIKVHELGILRRTNNEGFFDVVI